MTKFTGSPSRSVPVGPRKPAQGEEAAPEPAVTEYLVGEFEYYRARLPRADKNAPKMAISRSSIYLTEPLAAAMKEALGFLPDKAIIGIDTKRALIEVKPAAFGGLKVRPKSSGFALTSKSLMEWLFQQGVPLGQVDAKWQSQTQSIVGRYVPKAAQDSAAPSRGKAAASGPEVIEAYGHKMRLTTLTSQAGNRLYKCDVCGIFVADPRTPILKQRPCIAGRYESRYEVVNGKVYPRGDAWGVGTAGAEAAMEEADPVSEESEEGQER